MKLYLYFGLCCRKNFSTQYYLHIMKNIYCKVMQFRIWCSAATHQKRILHSQSLPCKLRIGTLKSTRSQQIPSVDHWRKRTLGTIAPLGCHSDKLMVSLDIYCPPWLAHWLLWHAWCKTQLKCDLRGIRIVRPAKEPWRKKCIVMLHRSPVRYRLGHKGPLGIVFLAVCIRSPVRYWLGHNGQLGVVFLAVGIRACWVMPMAYIRPVAGICPVRPFTAQWSVGSQSVFPPRVRLPMEFVGSGVTFISNVYIFTSWVHRVPQPGFLTLNT